MSKNSVVEFRIPESISDPLTALLCEGAKRLIQQAVEAELAELPAQHEGQVDEQGRRVVVRNSYLPEREIITGVGSVTVKVPKVRSRMDEPVVFRHSLVPPHVRKARPRRVEATLPWLYLKGTASGLKIRGLCIPPRLATGDGALGFWLALDAVYPETRHQRCWVHKAANVLNYLPKAVQPKAKQTLQEIWMAEDRASAQKACDQFVQTDQAKYPKAVACLEKDREALLACYDFPAEHWAHMRTTNPVESTFATIRHRTDRAEGCVSRNTMLAMI